MRLIDADVLKRALNIKPEDWNTPDERWRPESEFGKAIDAMPVIEAEPVKHGYQDGFQAGYNQGFAEIVKNCSVCHNCDIYRDAWNVCFVASECLINDFKFRKRKMDGGEND